MVASSGSERWRFARFIGGGALLSPIAIGAFFGWWLTSAPAPDHSAPPPAAVVRPVETAVSPAAPDPAPLAWPASRLEGLAAKQFLLDFTEQASRKLAAVQGYTAKFHRRERIGGKLGPDQTLDLKVRHEPFSVYLRFLAPRAGKEAIYAAGLYDDDVIAHNGDWTRRLIPRLKVDPASPIALSDNRHPITEAGLANLTNKLLHFRRLDLDDPHAVTFLDREVGDDGDERFRSLHLHDFNDGVRPFAKVEVFYCPKLLIPIEILSYEWPEPGCGSDDLVLGEHYDYDELDFDVELTAIDFDPDNPDYAFHR